MKLALGNQIMNIGNYIYECSYVTCRRLFKTKYSMKRHELTHKSSKHHICEHCGKKFILQHNLKEHVYTHTKEKPYVCQINGCNKRYRQAGKLSLHRRTHKEYYLKHYDCQVVYAEDRKVSSRGKIKSSLELAKANKENMVKKEVCIKMNNDQTTLANLKENPIKNPSHNLPKNYSPSATINDALAMLYEVTREGIRLLENISALEAPLVSGKKLLLPSPFVIGRQILNNK